MELMKVVCKKKEKPVGVIVATDKDGHLYTGWSLCCKEDTFDEVIGITKAHERESYNIDLDTVPHSIRKQLVRFANHARRFFIYNAKYK